MKVNNSRFLLVVLIIFSLINSGCSVIGYHLGAKIDNRRADYKIVKPENYETIKHSQIITVHLYDYSSNVGRFDGIDVVSATEEDFRDYTEKFLILKTRLGVERINLDEINSIEIKTTGLRPVKWFGLVLGLQFDYIIVVLLQLLTGTIPIAT